MITLRASRFTPLLFGLGLLSAVSGCGGAGEKATVAGTITLRGQPPKYMGLQIVFMAGDGTQASGAINDDGTYTAENVPSGDVKVCFAYVTPDAAREGAEFKTNGRKMVKPGEKKAVQPPKLTGKEPTKNPIPEALRDTSTSRLTLKVESGKLNQFDYDMP